MTPGPRPRTVSSIDDTPLPHRRRVLDAHVHPWPERLYRAILTWFDTHGWPILERLHGDDVDRALGDRGVTRYVAMLYAHRPGMAADLNAWMADYAARNPRAIPLGTVHPGDDVAAVTRHALDTLNLKGLKLHTHVMGLPVDDPRLEPALRMLDERRKPLVVHAGTEPNSDAYPRACAEVSGLERLERVLQRHSTLVCVIPHLGAGEYDHASRLLDRFENVHLDTAMVTARYFDDTPDRDWILRHSDRILYGTDFPILPYDYDRERRCLLGLHLGAAAEEALFWANGAKVFLGEGGDSSVSP